MQTHPLIESWKKIESLPFPSRRSSWWKKNHNFHEMNLFFSKKGHFSVAMDDENSPKLYSTSDKKVNHDSLYVIYWRPTFVLASWFTFQHSNKCDGLNQNYDIFSSNFFLQLRTDCESVLFNMFSLCWKWNGLIREKKRKWNVKNRINYNDLWIWN